MTKDAKETLRTVIIFTLTIAVIICCVAYIWPDLQSFKGIISLLLTWFSVGIVIDIVKTILICIHKAIKEIK